MAAEAEIGAEVPTKKGINKLFVIIGAAAAVVLVGGAGLFFFLSSGSATDASGAHGAGGDVAAIAADTGFADGAHLSKTFKIVYGINPSEQRKRLLSQSAKPLSRTAQGNDLARRIFD